MNNSSQAQSVVQVCESSSIFRLGQETCDGGGYSHYNGSNGSKNRHNLSDLFTLTVLDKHFQCWSAARFSVNIH